MKKAFLLFIILSFFIIQCSDESSNESGQSQINAEFTDNEQLIEEADYFSYEAESETNIIKPEEKSKTVV